MLLVSQIVSFNGFYPSTVGSIVILIGLLVLSAMISGSETALFSLNPANIAEIKRRTTKSDESIINLLSSQDYLLATILIANNFVNICIVILSDNILNRLFVFGSSVVWEFVIKVVIVTFLLLLFGEIMPKVAASYSPLRFARRVSGFLLLLRKVLKPFSYILVRSGSRFNDSVAKRRVNISMDELSDAIEITRHQTEQEKQILSGIVSFVNTEAEDIMKLRMDIVALDSTETFENVKKVIIDSGFSRIPVYEETLDNIKGILYVKDMLPYIGEDDAFQWQQYIRPAYFVPEHKKINDLLEKFQTNKVHVAIVVDEYGSTMGLVSLEDIVEEIVGEITDESDAREKTFYTKIDDNTYIFEGKTHLNDFEKVLGLDEGHFGKIEGVAETVAGLLLELKRDFMRKGESITANGMTFTVTSLDGRRIDKVRVRINR